MSTTHNYVKHQQPQGGGVTNINIESTGDSVEYTCRWLDSFNNGLEFTRCDRRFNCAEELMSHIRSVHFSGIACKCRKCEETKSQKGKTFRLKYVQFQNL